MVNTPVNRVNAVADWYAKSGYATGYAPNQLVSEGVSVESHGEVRRVSRTVRAREGYSFMVTSKVTPQAGLIPWLPRH